MTKFLMGWNATENTNPRGKQFDNAGDAMEFLWCTAPNYWPDTMVVVEGACAKSVEPLDWFVGNCKER